MSSAVALRGSGVDQLAAVLDNLTTEHVTAVGLGGQLRELVRLRNRLDAEISRRLSVFDASGAGSADGARTTKSWLQGMTRMSPREAKKQVTVARAVRDLPAVGKGYAAGDLSLDHVAAVDEAVSDMPDETREWADRMLAAASRSVRPDDVRRLGQRIRERVDPDAGLEAANNAYQRRDFSVIPVGDQAVVRGVLDAEGGALLNAALDAVMTPPAPDDTRTTGERRADAITELARRALDSDTLPTVAGQRPHLVVTLDYDTLVGTPDTAPTEADQTSEAFPGSAAGAEVPDAIVTPGGRLADWLTKAPVLDHHGPVPAATARRIACDAGVLPAVLGSDSAVLDLGRHTRVVTTALRRALAIRDRGCRFPGCDVPPQWTDGHHLLPWYHGGPTDVGNLLLLCRHHHRLVHEGGWTLTGHPNGTIHATRPDGTRLAP